MCLFGVNSFPAADVHLDGHGAPACSGSDGLLMREEYEVREGRPTFWDGMGLSCFNGESRRGAIVFFSGGAVVAGAGRVETFR